MNHEFLAVAVAAVALGAVLGMVKYGVWRLVQALRRRPARREPRFHEQHDLHGG